jgi:hypothetical protein
MFTWVESGRSPAMRDKKDMKLSTGALLCMLIAAPAHATGGLTCRTAGARPIEVVLVISHTVIPSVVSARLRDGRSNVTVRVAQSWLDSNGLRLDLVDSNAIRHELRLRANRDGQAFDGTLWRGGKHRWVRCRES